MQAIQLPIRNVIDQNGSDGSGVRNAKLLLRLMSTIVTRYRRCSEDMIGTSDRWSGGVILGILWEIANEIEDCEGSVECSSVFSSANSSLWEVCDANFWTIASIYHCLSTVVSFGFPDVSALSVSFGRPPVNFSSTRDGSLTITGD